MYFLTLEMVVMFCFTPGVRMVFSHPTVTCPIIQKVESRVWLLVPYVVLLLTAVTCSLSVLPHTPCQEVTPPHLQLSQQSHVLKSLAMLLGSEFRSVLLRVPAPVVCVRLL